MIPKKKKNQHNNTKKVKDLYVQIIIHFNYSLQMWAEFELVIFYLHDLVDEFHYHF